MIKISLTDEKRDNINKKYWELIKNHTQIINSFTDKGGRKELKKYNYKLEKFLYNKNKFCEDKLKELVTADKQKMLHYIKEFEIGEMLKEDTKHASQNLINNFFKYSVISRKEGFYDILKDLNVSVCPYCNRQYTFTIKSQNAKNIRPFLDHYYPKSKYPFLAISIWNLIPCCSSCNLLKSDKDTVTYPILYPYEKKVGEDINFDIERSKESDFVKFIYGLEDTFEVIIDESTLSQESKNHINLLRLIDFYNEHKTYIQNIIKKNYINSEDYINNLYQSYPQLFNTIDDVKNLIYMTDIEKENWIHNPLSKLTSDVLAFLDRKKI